MPTYTVKKKGRQDFGSWYDFVKQWFIDGDLYDSLVAECVMGFVNRGCGRYETPGMGCRSHEYCPLKYFATQEADPECKGFTLYQELYNPGLKDALKEIKEGRE